MPTDLNDPFDLSDPTEYPALLERQRVEIERLRAALLEIANHRIDSELASREKRSMAQAALKTV